MNKKLKKLASKTGSKIFDLADNLDELYVQINFGRDLSDKEFKKLLVLEHVKDIVRIASELFPYHVEA